MGPEFILPITEEEYRLAGSKFITFNSADPLLTRYYRAIECGMLDWETQGKSLGLPVVITEEGPDQGKEDKIAFGVTVEGVWKGKAIYLAVTGQEPPIKAGSPVFSSEALLGKPATGVWELQVDKRRPEEGGKGTRYPKLVDILPAGYRPKKVETLL